MSSLSGLSQRWEPRAWRLAAWPPASPGLGSAGRAAGPPGHTSPCRGNLARAPDFMTSSLRVPSFFFFPLHSGSGIHAGLSGNYLKSQAINDPMTGLLGKVILCYPKMHITFLSLFKQWQIMVTTTHQTG